MLSDCFAGIGHFPLLERSNNEVSASNGPIFSVRKYWFWLLQNLVGAKDVTRFWGHSQSLLHLSVSNLICINLAVFSTNYDWGSTNNGVACDSIKYSIPESGLTGVCSWGVLGHNSWGKSRKTSLMALLKDQTSGSESEPESLVGCAKFLWL